MKMLTLKVVLVLVLAISALMPIRVQASWLSKLGENADGITNTLAAVDMIKDLIPSKSADTTVIKVGDPLKVNSLYERRIVIDESQMSISGQYGGITHSYITAKLRSVMSASGKVLIVIGPRDFRFMAEIQDFVQDSGRYSAASSAQVARGQWLAPTDVVKMTGTAELVWQDKGLAVDSRSVNYRKVRAVVHLILEPIDIRTGVVSASYEATGQTEKIITYNIGGISSATGGNTQNDEQELIYKATDQALVGLVNQFEPAPMAPAVLPAPPIPVSVPTSNSYLQTPNSLPLTPSRLSGQVSLQLPSGKPTQIAIPANKPVGVGNQVWFVKGGQVSGKFTVTAVSGQTVKLECISGNEPFDGDGFAIIYP